MDGLRAPLIVYDRTEPVEYDYDETITVSGLFTDKQKKKKQFFFKK